MICSLIRWKKETIWTTSGVILISDWPSKNSIYGTAFHCPSNETEADRMNEQAVSDKMMVMNMTTWCRVCWARVNGTCRWRARTRLLIWCKFANSGHFFVFSSRLCRVIGHTIKLKFTTSFPARQREKEKKIITMPLLNRMTVRFM